MRLVVDTNVFVSAAIKDTAWPALVVRWFDRFGGLLKTSATEQEVFDMAQAMRYADRIDVRRVSPPPLVAEQTVPPRGKAPGECVTDRTGAGDNVRPDGPDEAIPQSPPPSLAPASRRVSPSAVARWS
jgi:hypothetical protein